MSFPILTSSAEIAAFASELSREPVIAVDLEADSMHSYQEKVCLLQFSTPTRTLLIDPLAGGDLAPLGPVLSNPAIRKVFHAADYDTRCLNRDYGFIIRGLFDTMISCQFLGEEKFGLADILGKYYGLTLDKQYQRADWSKRPLSPEMIDYAAADTTHLLPLAVLLEARLQEKNRLDWVSEEFELLEQGRFTEHHGPLFLRFKGAAAFDRRQLAILEGLLQWRDREAERRDKPPFKILGNDYLQLLVRQAPVDAATLSAIPGLPGWVGERFGKSVLPVIAAALALPEEELPRYPRAERRERDPAADQRLAVLKLWRSKIAGELELEPGILINNGMLEEISRKAPRTLAELEQIGMKRWQRRVLGAGIVDALKG